jgi:catechol 2,3-dioxygenase-like lactoylglutathione lyase family enzyme
MSTRAVPLWLDHASVAVPDLAAAVEQLGRRLGLRATVSAAAPERHSRVYLDRSYVEVSAGSRAKAWEATMFFLRFEEPRALLAHLDAAGIQHRFETYEGVDGTWDDVEVRAGTVPLPTLIRRTAPAEVARDWPPALSARHPCDARTLAAVHLAVPNLGEAVEVYGRLLGTDRVARVEGGRVRVSLTAGEIVLREAGPDEGLGLVLSVSSLDAARAVLGRVLGPTVDGIAWVDPVETSGLRLGFIGLA